MAKKYIELEAAIMAIEIPKVTPGGVIFDALKKACQEEVRNLPAADVVEVVRCRDCKYRDYDDAPYGEKVAVCTGAMAYSQTPDDWYCPMGERKDGGQDDV